ncbi:hypothetical protein [Streptomyces sp. NPDC048603]|uniref:hypothetical protein n=1 Tax=Streptomyces sp. NPDC048603 TaxID=3365577 RepID=UPI003717BA4A
MTRPGHPHPDRHRRLRAAAAVVLPALLAAGCGVKPTGVVESGRPATLTVAGEGDRSSMIYLIGPTGLITPVQRHHYPPYSAPDLLRLLAIGPTEEEQKVGLRSDLPTVPDLKERLRPAVIDYPSGSGGATRATLAYPVADLTEAARRQLVCTIAFSTSQGGRTPVILTGPDTSLPPTPCGIGT